MRAIVRVMLREGVHDPQGRAIGEALRHLGFDGVREVRAGKLIELDLEAAEAETARAEADAMARKLLANTVIEGYAVEILP